MAIQKLLPLIVMTIVSTATLADDSVKNGKPCLSGVCVGDELSTLTSIKWEPAKNDLGRPIEPGNPISESSLNALLKMFAPQSESQVRAAAPYPPSSNGTR